MTVDVLILMAGGMYKFWTSVFCVIFISVSVSFQKAWLEQKPHLRQVAPGKVLLNHCVLGEMIFEVDAGPDGTVPTLLFTENDTNSKLLFKCVNKSPYVKDAFHNYVVKGQ